jgi:hypothetical protein
MRKLFLISVLLLASVSAQAGERILAAGTPAIAASTNSPQPLPPVAKDDKMDDKADQAKPQAVEPAATQPRSPKPRSQARRDDDDEAKARRIAAKYGISW